MVISGGSGIILNGDGTLSSKKSLLDGGNAVDFWWEYIIVGINRYVGGSSYTYNEYDQSIQVNTSTALYFDNLISTYPTESATSGQLPTYTSSNTGIAQINISGYMTHISDGSVNITLSSAIRNLVLPFNLTASGGITTSGYLGDISGSVRYNATHCIDDKLSNIYTKEIFSTQDHSTKTYVRSTGCWARNINLSCCSPWNSDGGIRKAGTLISPRHIIYAAHYPINIGSTIRFVTTGNVVVERVLTNVTNLDPLVSTLYYPDFRIGLLDSDITTCTFAKVLPTGFANYISQDGFGIPILCLDQEEKALVKEIANLTYQYHAGEYYTWCRYPSTYNRIQFYENIISGDSGNPAFIIINNEPILLTVWTYRADGMGTFVSSWYTAINTAMTGLGGGYTLTAANITGFLHW